MKDGTMTQQQGDAEHLSLLDAMATRTTLQQRRSVNQCV